MCGEVPGEDVITIVPKHASLGLAPDACSWAWLSGKPNPLYEFDNTHFC
jgi:hypothetical protein